MLQGEQICRPNHNQTVSNTVDLDILRPFHYMFFVIAILVKTEFYKITVVKETVYTQTNFAAFFIIYRYTLLEKVAKFKLFLDIFTQKYKYCI